MKVTKMFAMILITLGIVALVYHGITFTTNDNVFDMGPMHLSITKTNTVPLPPLVGGIALVSGIALLVLGRKSRH